MATPRILHVTWEGPLSLSQALSLNDVSKDFGLYQVYGAHPVYGPGALLYIGRAEKRTFGARFLEHLPWVTANQDSDTVQIYAGRLSTFDTTPNNEEWERQIREVESLLIFAHGPAANSSGLNSVFTAEYDDIHVLNWGNFRALLPEVSGARYAKHYWNREGLKPYAGPPKSAP